MPLLKYLSDKFPNWSEIDKIEHLYLNDLAEYVREINSKAALFLIQGDITCTFNNLQKVLHAKASLFIPSGTVLQFKASSAVTEIFIIYGNWGDETGNSNFFTIKNSSTPRNIGDQVQYSRTTDFDNHFHDCDEYWFILKGSGVAYSEGIQYNFREGACIATQSGQHHDLPQVSEEITGIYFETTLKGLKRKGHLWKHTHQTNISRESNEL